MTVHTFIVSIYFLYISLEVWSSNANSILLNTCFNLYLEDLLSCYNSTLSNLLNIHAPLITEQSSHANNLWFTSYIQAFKTFCRHLEHGYNPTIDPASRAEALTNLKSATHRYHTLVIAAKQKYYSSLQLFQPSTPLESS